MLFVLDYYKECLVLRTVTNHTIFRENCKCFIPAGNEPNVQTRWHI